MTENIKPLVGVDDWIEDQPTPIAPKQKRKSISKGKRFEVFKRDGFVCQYCGAYPPSVILHVDHVLAVVRGGTNDMENLVTACQSCNGGKGARDLATVPKSLTSKTEDIREREAQIRGYQAVIESRLLRLNAEVDRVAEIYERFNQGYTLNDDARRSVRRFIEALGVHRVCDAMERTYSKEFLADYKRFRYFCGVCWRIIKEGDGPRA